MKFTINGRNAALAAAVFGAAGMGWGPVKSFATPYTIGTSTDTLIERTPYANSTTVLEIEGFTSGGTNFRSFGVFDFNSASLGIVAPTTVTSVNAASFNLTDLDYLFAKPGTFNIFVSTNNNALTGLSYQTTDPTGGIGSQLGTLTQIGSFMYQPGGGGTNSSGGSTTNTPIVNNLDLSAVGSYLVGQINNGGNIRIVVATPTASAVGDFVGPTGASGAPSLSLDLTTTTIAQTDAVLTVNGGTKSQTFNVARMLNTATYTTTATLTNSGMGSGTYNTASSVFNAGTATSNAVATVGVEPVPGAGGTSNLTVGIAPVGTAFGTSTSATVTVHNQSNASDGNITITLQAADVVGTRIVDNANGSSAPLKFGRVLGGTASSQNVTITTTNKSLTDYSPNALTTVELLGNTSLSNVLLTGLPSTLNADAASIAAGTGDVVFDNQSNSTVRSVTFNPGTTVGGQYQSNVFYEGYLAVPLVNLDSAFGASTTPYAGIFMEADVYQPALVTGKANGTLFALSNANHTKNSITSLGGDIGIRSLAEITLVSLSAPAGYNLDAGLTVGASIADGATVTATSFDPTAKWNGVYTGSLTVGLQNDHTLTGAVANDLGNATYSLSNTVSGNSGSASVNVLAGKSFAGYSIPSGLARNTTVSLLGGTSSSGNTLSATWSAGSSTSALSDKVTLTRTAADTIVVQMTYDPTGVTSATATSPELAFTNGSGVNVLAVLGNANGSPSEVIGAYDGNTTLGHYGIDPVAHTVWAVVDHVGSFEAFQRKLGDATGDGTVDLSDLNMVLSNLGTTTALWSRGNFDGAATIDLNDLNAVLNNLGTSLPSGANSLADAEQLLTGFSPDFQPPAPEPTTLAIAGIGTIGLVLRRKSRIVE